MGNPSVNRLALKAVFGSTSGSKKKTAPTKKIAKAAAPLQRDAEGNVIDEFGRMLRGRCRSGCR